MNSIEPILQAVSFAADKHRNQRRKDPEASPYINHPIAVAELLAQTGRITDLELIQAALLHDTIEDTATTGAELEGHFGPAVRQLVEEVTDDKSLPKPERKQRQVDHAPHLSPRAKQLKIADKTCNVRDVTRTPPANWPRERRLEYLDWAERVVAGCRGENAPLEAAFDAALAEGRLALG